MFRSLDAGAIGVRAPFETVLEWAEEFGFEGLSLSADLILEKGPEKIRDLLEQHQLRPSVFGLPVEFRKDEETFRKEMESLPEKARAAAEVGLTRCSTWVLPGKTGMPDEAYFEELRDRLGQCARILHDHGIRLGLEFIGPKTLRDEMGLETPGLSTAEAMLKLVKAIDVPGTGILLDSWHWYTSHGTPQIFAKLRDDLVVDVHVNDAPGGIPVDEQIDNRRMLPGATGIINLTFFFAGLRKIRYSGPVTVEPFNEELNALEDREAVRATADALKTFL